MKTCSKCKQSKDSSEFNKKNHSKDGLQYRCKACMFVYHKQHYQDNVQYYKDKAVKNKKKPVDHIRKYKLTEEENLFLINALHEYRGKPLECNLDHTPNVKLIESLAEQCTGSFKDFKELMDDLEKEE